MRLLYAIDLRARDLWRLDEVGRWASTLSGTVDIVFVDPFGAYEPYVLNADLAEDLKEGLERSRQRDLATLREAMAGLPEAVRGEIDVLAGDPATAVCEKAKGYDALVVSTRGREGAARLWLGSVAERIVRTHHGDTIVING